MKMNDTEKARIETEALLKRADIAIQNTGKIPHDLSIQLAHNDGFFEQLEQYLEEGFKILGPEEIERIMNLSDEELDAEYRQLEEELRNDPLFDDIFD